MVSKFYIKQFNFIPATWTSAEIDAVSCLNRLHGPATACDRIDSRLLLELTLESNIMLHISPFYHKSICKSLFADSK
jgi:hypothetical protein